MKKHCCHSKWSKGQSTGTWFSRYKHLRTKQYFPMLMFVWCLDFSQLLHAKPPTTQKPLPKLKSGLRGITQVYIWWQPWSVSPSWFYRQYRGSQRFSDHAPFQHFCSILTKLISISTKLFLRTYFKLVLRGGHCISKLRSLARWPDNQKARQTTFWRTRLIAHLDLLRLVAA